MARLAIALALCMTTLAHAGAMHKGHCYQTGQDAATVFASEVNGYIFPDGSYYQHQDTAVNANDATFYGFKVYQPATRIPVSMVLHYPECQDSFGLVGVSSGSLSLAIGLGFALVFSLAFLGYGLGIALRLIRRI